MSNHTGQGGTARAGGRPKEYTDAAARAKAWRDRRRADRTELSTAPGAGSLMPRTTGTLAGAVPTLTALAQRIEAAVAALTDPATLDELLEGTRTADTLTAEVIRLREARDEARRDLDSERTARRADRAAADASLAAARDAHAVRLEAAAAVAAVLREQLMDLRSDRDAILARLDARPEPSLIGH